MEPVSLAFGVVSLGMQLVQTAAAIRERIDAYKSAAKELSTLSDKLDNIEAICYSLEAAFSCCEQAPKPWDAMLLKKLHRIMSDCRDKVSRLYDIINKITSSQSNKRISLNTTGARFLQYRGTIRKCNDELDQSLTSLHLHMTTNILVMNLRPLPQTCESLSLNITTTTQVEPSIKNSVDSAVIKYRKSRSRQDVQTQTWNLSYSSLCRLERTKVRKARQSKSSPSIQEETSFLIGSPLLGLYAKLSLQRGSLSPLSVSLQFPHIYTFTFDSWFFTDIARAFRMDDVEKLRYIFDQYSITPHTDLVLANAIVARTDTLLGWAIWSKANRIHDFLIDQCPSLFHGRRHLPINHSMLLGPSPAPEDPDGSFTRAMAYIDMRGDALEPGEFSILLNGCSLQIHKRFLVDTCKQHFSGEWEPFNRYIWNHIFSSFKRACVHSVATVEEFDKEAMGSLADLTRQAISDGLDIHCSLTIHGQPRLGLDSALENLVNFGPQKDDTVFFCHQWAEMLCQAGVDVDTYLEREMQALSAACDPYLWEGAYVRELKVEKYMGRNLPTWVMSFAATDAPELFSEFPHLVAWDSFGNIIPGRKTPGDIHRMVDGPKPHQDWKQVLQVGGGVIHPPLERWSLNWYRPPRPLDEEGRKMVEGLAYACDLMESRFERKRLKKLRKAGYMRELAPLRFKERIPGTWVE